jgi:glycosyltransferase involved in cell wall biosynthesis
MDKPLISFSISCYNQESFIREAVQGAFSQTYSPLEIVISDDCSKDRTFDIAQQMVAAYKGPHTVQLNRNERNLGISGNANRASALCHGELIVGAAGDDISVPERTSITVQAWNDSGRKATTIFSRYVVIDESGRSVEGATEVGLSEGTIKLVHEQVNIAGFIRRRRPHITGCAYAISQKLLTLFGPLPETVTYEDTAFCFRTILAGGVFTFIDSPLVKYRRHGNNLTFALHQVRPQSVAVFEEVQRKRRIELDRYIEVYKCFAADAERAMQQGLIPPEEYPSVKKQILKEGRRFQLKSELLIQPWFRRLCIFFQLYSNTIRPRELLEHSPHLLPRTLYCTALTARNRIPYQKQKRLP